MTAMAIYWWVIFGEFGEVLHAKKLLHFQKKRRRRKKKFLLSSSFNNNNNNGYF